MDTSVVIVTWNAEALIADCVRTIPSGTEVVVVDNASVDRTIEVARRGRPEARVIVNPSNRGFAAAANQGIRAATSDRVLLLNPDARLAPDTIDDLGEALESDPRIAAASALVTDERGKVERQSAGREPTPIAVALHELGLWRLLPRRSLYGVVGSEPVVDRDWVAGTCVMLRRATFLSIGGFDESYFLYCEDMDLCRRLRNEGHRVVVARTTPVVHLRSTSVNRAGAWIDVHRIGSLDRYVSIHHPLPSLTIVRVARLLGAAFRALAFTVVSLLPARRSLAARARQRRGDTRLLARAILGRPPAP